MGYVTHEVAKGLIEAGAITKAKVARDTFNDMWDVFLTLRGSEELMVMKTQRGEIKKHKTLEAAANEIRRLGFIKFEVYLGS